MSQISRVRGVIETHNGFGYARQKAQDLIDTAITELSIFTDGPPKETLISLAHYVLTRKK